MKRLKITTLLITFMLFTLNSCKNPINTDEISAEKSDKPQKIYDDYEAHNAIKVHLIKIGAIENEGQVSIRTSKIFDKNKHGHTATFYFENLLDGDYKKDFIVEFDGNEYFVQ